MALDFEHVADLLSGLTLLKYFPADDGARLELAKMVAGMAVTEDQVEWLCRRVLALCNEWPGPLTIRQIFCSKFKPKDGIEAGRTQAFPEGVPSERVAIGFTPTGSLPAARPRQQIGAGESADLIPLPPGHKVSVDPEMEKLVAAAVEHVTMPAARPLAGDTVRFAKQLEETITSPQDRPLPPVPPAFPPGVTPISESDVEHILREERAKKSGGEA